MGEDFFGLGAVLGLDFEHVGDEVFRRLGARERGGGEVGEDYFRAGGSRDEPRQGQKRATTRRVRQRNRTPTWLTRANCASGKENCPLSILPGLFLEKGMWPLRST